MSRLALISGSILTVTGLSLVTLFALLGSEVDEKGVLREPFYLIGIGAPSLALGLPLLLVSTLLALARRTRGNRSSKG